MAENDQPTFFEANPRYATLVFAAQDARERLVEALSGELDRRLTLEGDPEYERYGRPSNDEYLADYVHALWRVREYENEHPDEARACAERFGAVARVEGIE